MTYDEAKAGLSKLLENPDTAQAGAAAFLDALKGDYETLTSVKGELETAQNRIRDLQDTNTKLFLAQTSKIPEEKEDSEEYEGADAIEHFINTLVKKTEG